MSATPLSHGVMTIAPRVASTSRYAGWTWFAMSVTAVSSALGPRDRGSRLPEGDVAGAFGAPRTRLESRRPARPERAWGAHCCEQLMASRHPLVITLPLMGTGGPDDGGPDEPGPGAARFGGNRGGDQLV